MPDPFPEITGLLGFGCMRLPMTGRQVDLPLFTEMVDLYMASGLRYFDTAHGYLNGQSETALRQALAKRYDRGSFVLANKLTANFFSKPEDIRPLFEKQLESCGVDYFDFYLMHAQDAANYEKYRRCGAYRTALKLREEGKIRHFGISFHDKAAVLDRILTDWPQIEAVQMQLNYLDEYDASVESRKVYEVCEKHAKPVFVMEPVKGGSLVRLPPEAQAPLTALNERRGVQESNASYALRFAAGFPLVRLVLSGMSDPAQVRQNIAALSPFRPLDEEEREAIDQVRQAFAHQRMIPCTGCRYCVEENHCPRDLLIPELFSCMNQKQVFHNWNQDFYYQNALTRNHGKASDCVQCGRCEAVCPQHLPIRDLLREVAAAFERRKRK